MAAINLLPNLLPAFLIPSLSSTNTTLAKSTVVKTKRIIGTAI